MLLRFKTHTSRLFTDPKALETPINTLTHHPFFVSCRKLDCQSITLRFPVKNAHNRLTRLDSALDLTRDSCATRKLQVFSCYHEWRSIEHDNTSRCACSCAAFWSSLYFILWRQKRFYVSRRRREEAGGAADKLAFRDDAVMTKNAGTETMREKLRAYWLLSTVFY